jgi:hypothetical protein
MYTIAFFYIIAYPYPSTMKNEVHNAASRLLEILYMRDVDHPALASLTLPHKYDAIELLIANGLVFEEEIHLQTDVLYSYYSITEEGEKQFESGGFKPRQKTSATAYTLIMVAAIAIAVGFTLFLVFRG